MRRFFIFLTLFIGFSLNAAEFNMPTYYAKIEKINENTAEIADNKDIIVGSSGIVMHKFSNNEHSIIARAVVTEKNGVKAKIRFEVFSMLEQKSLPLPGILPSEGDLVALNYLYDRSLIIAPNAEIYEQIVKAFPNINFVHPDIVGAYLNYNFKPNPNRDDFRKICANNAAGLIFIALNGEGVFADCGSFEVLKSFKSGAISYYQLPFYTNIDKINTMFFDFKNGEINDYDKHYNYLLDRE